MAVKLFTVVPVGLQDTQVLVAILNAFCTASGNLTSKGDVAQWVSLTGTGWYYQEVADHSTSEFIL